MATAEAAIPQLEPVHAGEEEFYEGGLWSWLTTVDHKRIGIMYFVAAFIFFLLGGAEALLIRLQLAQPDAGVVSADMYNQLFTMHGTTMVFLAGMPLAAAFFNLLVPLQIGARDVAFPRLNAFSFWTFLFGGLLLNASWFVGGAPDAGWFGYANLTSTTYSPGMRIDFWVFGLQVLGVSSLASALNFATTILNMRAEGMNMMRLPLFSWMTLVTAFLIILAFPAITVGLFMLMFDRMFGAVFFDPAAGGSVLLWQHLFWIFGHPEVYILILPAFGIVSEVIPTFSRKPLFGYPVVVFSGMLIAFLGFGVWAHHMFATGMGPIPNAVFSAMTMLIAVPTGVKIFNWIATMWGGKIKFTTPLLFAVGMIGLFIVGGLSGVMHSSPPTDLQQTDSYFIVAHLHYVLFGGLIMGVFSGAYYWFPKFTGKKLDETLGKWHFWGTFIAMNLTFFPMHIVGMGGMPRRTFTYEAGLGFETYNLVETIGAFLLGAVTLIFVWNLWKSLRNGEEASANPWGGSTLEWSMPSPVPHYNFASLPVIGGRDPLWREGGVRAPEPEGEPHMPDPSHYPILTAFGILVLAAGALVNLWVVLAGFAVTIYGIYRWALEPAGH